MLRDLAGLLNCSGLVNLPKNDHFLISSLNEENQSIQCVDLEFFFYLGVIPPPPEKKLILEIRVGPFQDTVEYLYKYKDALHNFSC